MAWSIVPRPGTKVGPCKGECQHTDCAATRKLAATICRYCQQEIGYGGKYTMEAGEPVHFICLVEHVESESTSGEERKSR